MKYAISIFGVLAWLFGCYAFNNGYTGVWMRQGDQVYTYGELYYQCGLMLLGVCSMLAMRWGAKGWALKLVYNCFIELFAICLLFSIIDNPYHINWDEILMCEISAAALATLYLTCYLFPKLRKIII